MTGLSEEQITDIFSSAGKVERFRLVYDSETGRPKGFGFADYPDTGTIETGHPTLVHQLANRALPPQTRPLRLSATLTNMKSWVANFGSTSPTSKRAAMMMARYDATLFFLFGVEPLLTKRRHPDRTSVPRMAALLQATAPNRCPSLLCPLARRSRQA